MDFRILGSLEVRDGDLEVPLGSAKERTLLAVLLLHAGGVVSRDRLIDELWGESPPPTASKALNVHVSQLRKALVRNGQDPIATRHPGYALEVDPDRVDSERFERLVGDARERVAAGDLAASGTLLRDALALWRGPALDGVELESAARNEVGRLEELRLIAQLDRIDCDLALGLHEQVIAELERLVDEHPLRERVRGQLILALYRSGRQADALRAYREARETLVEELGIEPSPPLQRLEKAILNQDPSLSAPAGVARGEQTREPGPERARGPRRAFVVGASALAGALAIAVVATVALSGGGHGLRRVQANAVGLVDPVTGEIRRSVAVGQRPSALATGAGSLWVANTGDETVSRLTGDVVRTIALSGHPVSLAFGRRGLWVVTAERRLLLVDPHYDNVAASFALPLRPAGIAVGGGYVWVSGGGTTVLRKPEAGGPLLTIVPDDGAYGPLAFGAGRLWVSGQTAVTPVSVPASRVWRSASSTPSPSSRSEGTRSGRSARPVPSSGSICPRRCRLPALPQDRIRPASPSPVETSGSRTALRAR